MEGRAGADEVAVIEDPEAYVYANVYRVSRRFGGHEEGGWWYDAGQPLESRRVKRGVVEAEVRALKAEWADEQPRRNRFSVIGGPDIEVYIEDHVAEPFPKERPRYE